MRPFKLCVSKSRTINLGNYESIKVEVLLEENFTSDDGVTKDEAFEEINTFVESRLQHLEDQAKNKSKKTG